jgi:hypothetical protein
MLILTELCHLNGKHAMEERNALLQHGGEWKVMATYYGQV